jgi:hypothetical protein
VNVIKLKKYILIVASAIMLFNCKLEVKATDFPTSGFNNFIKEIDEYIYPPESENYDIIGHSGKKTFMGYKTITDKKSEQYALQQDAYTDSEGFRRIDDRYCVAIGTAFGVKAGQLFDATLENGTTIKCIVGDIKKEFDTDSTNVFTTNGCCLEFIVDTKKLYGTIVMKRGDCSFRCEEWDSPCVSFKIYDLNYFEKGEEEWYG